MKIELIRNGEKEVFDIKPFALKFIITKDNKVLLRLSIVCTRCEKELTLYPSNGICEIETVSCDCSEWSYIVKVDQKDFYEAERLIKNYLELKGV